MPNPIDENWESILDRNKEEMRELENQKDMWMRIAIYSWFALVMLGAVLTMYFAH